VRDTLTTYNTKAYVAVTLHPLIVMVVSVKLAGRGIKAVYCASRRNSCTREMTVLRRTFTTETVDPVSDDDKTLKANTVDATTAVIVAVLMAMLDPTTVVF
jgi:hypothetical protein